MWYKLSKWIISNRVILISITLLFTLILTFYASKVKTSFDPNVHIPKGSTELEAYNLFKKKYGDDSHTMFIGFIKPEAGKDSAFFIEIQKLLAQYKKDKSVTRILSAFDAIIPSTSDSGKNITQTKIFDSLSYNFTEKYKKLLQQPFYKGLLFNSKNHSHIIAVSLDKDLLFTKERETFAKKLTSDFNKIGAKYDTKIHFSGLPYIRIELASLVKKELVLFLGLSVLVMSVLLMLIFRSWLTLFISLFVVGVGVVSTLATIYLFGYEITILTGVVPALMVIIGIPNCIYFITKYHSTYQKTGNKQEAILEIIGSMGIVTLFTNLTTAIGFGVFAFTQSALLREFGYVAGINVLITFIVSVIMIPSLLYYFPAPKMKQVSYLDKNWLNNLISFIIDKSVKKNPVILGISVLIMIVSIIGISQMKQVGKIIDDLPERGTVNNDLAFFEKEFNGVMPLEIIISTDKKYGAIMDYGLWQAADQVSNFMDNHKSVGTTLSLIRTLKLFRQGFNGGNVSEYQLPSSMEHSALRTRLISLINKSKSDTTFANNPLHKALYSYMDTAVSELRLSITVKDVGMEHLPKFIGEVKKELYKDIGNEYKVTVTGASVAVPVGNKMIVDSLGSSILLAFLMITVCIVILFRSWKVVIISIIVNIIPLTITAGMMGWLGIGIKPSTVLVFSVALGIAVDVCIRFLVAYKQELKVNNGDIVKSLRATISETGISIIFTSLVLMLGFIVFSVSEFQGTMTLGLLMSLTLGLSMLTVLFVMPILIVYFYGKKIKSAEEF